MRFEHSTWSSPASSLSAADYCAVCLVDLNEPGRPKVKAKCKLPVRRKPGAPYNTNALRAAAARLSHTDITAAQKRAAARKLVRLMRQARMSVGETMLRMAGLR